MLFSLACVFLFGLLASFLFGRLKLPRLLGMLLIGILLGPQMLDLLNNSILSIAGELRQLALVIILTRVGLSLDIADLKKVGRPAILMCWLPATFEIAGVILLGTTLLDISWLDAAIMGSVLAAVSPAVIVPKMLGLMERGYGKRKSIPQLIMAGSSMDDVYVIVLFTSFVSMAMGKGIDWAGVMHLPLAIVTGVAVGIASGWLFVFWFKKYHMRDSVKVIIILSTSFLFLSLEKLDIVPFAGLLAVICSGLVILKRYEILAKRLAGKFSKLWVGAEILLFVLVGAAVDVKYALAAGGMIVVVILLALLFRALGVFASLLDTSLSSHERLFCVLAYIPKATVQAAIGAIPLGLGLPCGQMVLTVAVISILLTAPLGAMAIDLTYRKLLADDR